MTDLGTLGTWSEAWGINDSGQAAGWSYSVGSEAVHAFLWSNGQMTDLGTLVGPSGTSGARGINNSGQIVGGSSSALEPSGRAVIWSNGQMIELGTLDIVGGTRAIGGYGINNSGQAVGVLFGLGPAYNRGFLYSGGQMTHLDELIGWTSDWSSRAATGINDSAQIIGWAYHGGKNDIGFLMTPIPEPSTFVLLGIGVLSLCVCGCWRRWRAG
jgi:probable HAF family extracellular repeat protein